MSMIVVNGGRPLAGQVAISGSKNACLPIMAAALLNEQPVKLHNVPRLVDVRLMSEVLTHLGAECQRDPANGKFEVHATGVTSTEPPYQLVNRMRASFLVLGPLLARFGEASVPLPGGCEIGPRPVGEHIKAMEALGATVTQEAGRIVARADKLKGTRVHLDIDSVGATENAIMAATLAEGTSEIHNAALEPEVADLCCFLERCGVELSGIGTKTVTVHGQPRIAAAVDYTVIPDRIEAGTYMLAVASTHGDAELSGLRLDHLDAVTHKLEQCGVRIEGGPERIRLVATAALRATNIRTAIYPGFPTDLQPQMTVMLSIAEGVSTVVETIFEKRLGHVPELTRMGAQIRVSGDTAVIEGRPDAAGRPTLTGVPVEAHDIRCAAALVIAGLIAQGETRIAGLKYLLRGYENLPEKLAGLGGRVHFEETDCDEAERA